MGADHITSHELETGQVTLQPISDLEIRILRFLFEAQQDLHVDELWSLCGGPAHPVVAAANLLHQKRLIHNHGFMCALEPAGKMALLSLVCANRGVAGAEGNGNHGAGHDGGCSAPEKLDSLGAVIEGFSYEPKSGVAGGRAEANRPTAITPLNGAVMQEQPLNSDPWTRAHEQTFGIPEIHIVPDRKPIVKVQEPCVTCFEPTTRRCAHCGKPICSTHGYGEEKNLCFGCKGEVEVEQAGESSYGRAAAR